jgi:hypothetical protein
MLGRAHALTPVPARGGQAVPQALAQPRGISMLDCAHALHNLADAACATLWHTAFLAQPRDIFVPGGAHTQYARAR